MKTCTKLRKKIALITSLLLLGTIALGSELSQEQGVVIDKSGGTTLFAFPYTIANPVGQIVVGNTIVVIYSIHVTRGGKSRFIQMQPKNMSSKMEGRFAPKLQATSGQSGVVGFLVKDSGQKQLDIRIAPKLMDAIRQAKAQESAAGMKRVLSHQGNLDVRISNKDGQYFISEIVVE